eukprot:1141484-Pleurochrysis_carterae.AAC.2
MQTTARQQGADRTMARRACCTVCAKALGRSNVERLSDAVEPRDGRRLSGAGGPHADFRRAVLA